MAPVSKSSSPSSSPPWEGPDQQQAQTKSRQPKSTPRPRQQPGSACDGCRERKLRCDRQQPQCGTCANAGVECHFRTTRPPRGPKKGHQKVLRDQIAALESRLDSQEKALQPNQPYAHQNGQDNHETSYDYRSNSISTTATGATSSTTFGNGLWPELESVSNPFGMPMNGVGDDLFGANGKVIPTSTSGNVVNECLTSTRCVELDQLYFDRVHPFASMVHRGRYFSWSKQNNKSKERICLQQAMWMLAASLSSQFQYLRDPLYIETRTKLDALDVDDIETDFKSLERVQAWILVTMYEFMSNKYQRGLVSAGRVLRLTQLLHLYEVDAPSVSENARFLEDSIEAESARRTFWVAYMIDRFVCRNDGLPLTLSEQEIRTRLPTTETEFQNGQYLTTGFLSQVIASDAGSFPQSGNSSMSPLAECILVATICARSIVHKERSTEEQAFGELTPDFHRRHQWLDATLATRIRSLSVQLTQSMSSSRDTTLIFAALAAHANVLYLCTILESMPLGIGNSQALLADYKQRAASAVQEICRIATTLTRLDTFQTHPLMPIPLRLCIKFILAHSEFREDNSKSVQEIVNALERLNCVNSLAQDTLHFIDASRRPGMNTRAR